MSKYIQFSKFAHQATLYFSGTPTGLLTFGASFSAFEVVPLVIFWMINIGLMLMVVLSLLPIGLMQTWDSVKYGMWYARSAEFLAQKENSSFVWMRIIGDTIFAIGALGLG